MSYITELFYFDALAALMVALVGFIGLTVASFASRYMKGDTHYYRFFYELAALVLCVMLMVSADHLVMLLLSWAASNALLVRLMIHKSSWKAARASGALAARTHLLGLAYIAMACMFFYAGSGETSIQAIIQSDIAESGWLLPALLALFVGAASQSAIWPFHKWLTSSLNSPTPVSALMHAGLINGGGFLLARFGSLYLEAPLVLNIMFIFGIATAMMGTTFKLLQSDVKRMLACSTLGQMGFMLAQCALGLFPAAVTHLVWHGLFKAYLFLASGSTAQDKRTDRMVKAPRPAAFGGGLLCGAAGAYAFVQASGKTWLAMDTTLVLVMVTFIAASQFGLTMLRGTHISRLPLALLATATMSALYGLNVHVIDWLLAPMDLMQPQPLNAIYIAGMVLLGTFWLGFTLYHPMRTGEGTEAPAWLLSIYVRALNASQPQAKTITTHRNHYDYI